MGLDHKGVKHQWIQSWACWPGGGFKYFFIYTQYLGKIPILTFIFFEMGWNHQLQLSFDIPRFVAFES